MYAATFQNRYHLGAAVAEQMVMDPRADYMEVASLVTGAVSECLAPQERLRLQRFLATSPEYLKDRVSFILDHFGKKAMELTYVAQGMVYSVSPQASGAGPQGICIYVYVCVCILSFIRH
jgi:hypothetical protein